MLDTDPQIAADIANYIYKLVDKVKRRVAKNRAQMGLQIVENEYRSLQGEIQTMEDKITELRFKGVHDYESQSAVFNEQYAIALAAGAFNRASSSSSVALIPWRNMAVNMSPFAMSYNCLKRKR